MRRSEAYRFRANIETAAQTVDDNTALRMREFYPTFAELCEKSYTAEKIGFRFRYGDKLYKTRQAGHTFVAHYQPGVGTESLYEVINETYAGTADDPIPYGGNMTLTAGLYYMQSGEIYRCTRDTKIPVVQPLAELVGQYVEKV